MARNKRWNKWDHFGPFDYYTLKSGCISAWLRGHENANWGWQWGIDTAVDRRPIIWIQIGRLILFSFERFKKGFELWVLGFWWIR